MLRLLRQRSLAALRREVSPTSADALARFLPAWHGIGVDSGGIDSVFAELSWTLGAGFENLRLQFVYDDGRNLSATGNELDNIISTTEPILELGTGFGGGGNTEGPVWWSDGADSRKQR